MRGPKVCPGLEQLTAYSALFLNTYLVKCYVIEASGKTMIKPLFPTSKIMWPRGACMLCQRLPLSSNRIHLPSPPELCVLGSVFGSENPDRLHTHTHTQTYTYTHIYHICHTHTHMPHTHIGHQAQFEVLILNKKGFYFLAWAP